MNQGSNQFRQPIGAIRDVITIAMTTAEKAPVNLYPESLARARKDRRHLPMWNHRNIVRKPVRIEACRQSLQHSTRNMRPLRGPAPAPEIAISKTAFTCEVSMVVASAHQTILREG